jgi:hypothetical protein
VNLQAYANHRKALGLRGQSHVAVLNAIQDGRLSAPAVRREGRAWVIDADVADQQWAATTDLSGPGGGAPRPLAPPSKGRRSEDAPPPPSPGGVPPLAASKAIKAAFDAKLAQLEYQRQKGEVCDVAAMKREAFTLGKTVRDGILGIVPRISADLAALSDQYEIEQLLETEFNLALRALADG